jgi:hypothetical protein
MLTFIDAMRDWASSRGTSLQGLVAVNFREGRTDVQKRSADIGFQTGASLGVVTVWDSGELETEAIDIQTELRFAVRSDVLSEPGDLPGALEVFAHAILSGLPGPSESSSTT